MEIAPDQQRRFRVIRRKKAFNLVGTGAIVGWLFNFPEEIREAVRQGLHRADLLMGATDGHAFSGWSSLHIV